MSVCILICGNGSIDAGETCDDGNVIANDGCTNCAIDPGW
jgi:cysteine-rich repeat protein